MRLLLWDFDGTLGYREGGMFAAAMVELARAEVSGLEIAAEDLQPYLQSGFPWHTPDRPHPEIETAESWWDALAPMFERGFRSVGIEAQRARTLAHQVRHIYADPSHWRLLDQALATLDGLTTRGWTHVLLSNHVPELRSILDHLELTSRFLRIFNSAETGYEKPHPLAFQVVLDTFPAAETIWMIGDSVRADVMGAESLGIPAILVHRKGEAAKHVCPTLSDVSAVLAAQR
jgi:putative hydrolase of the HAD superfamily